MAEYQAKPGREDRHGEMTGAITINMILSMPPVGIWAIFVGPYFVADVWWRLGIALAMAVVLPLAFMPLSRWLWAHLSLWSDTRWHVMRDGDETEGR